MIFDEAEYLAHYGILRKSGRYPWGSGGTQSQRNRSFLSMVEDLRKQGLSETEVAQGLGITTTQLRNARAIALEAKKQEDIAFAQKLRDKGLSKVEIGKRMGIGDTSVGLLLRQGEDDKRNILQATSKILRDSVDEKKYVDVGTNVERHMGISKDKLRAAVQILVDEGYTLHKVKVEQLGTGNKTEMKVLAGKNVPWSEVVKNRGEIQQVMGRSVDHGRTYNVPLPPISIDSKRVKVAYGSEGGKEADGMIYVRPGVKDVSLGKSNYAQVRIAVDGTHYLKGMAVYRDDLPNGYDLVFNTNKESTGNKLDAMKPLKRNKITGEIDMDDPFGAVIRDQIKHTDANGKETLTSTMNIVNSEGDWGKWSKNLSSQMLSKQSRSLVKSQLDEAYDRKRHELDEILGLNNPTVQKKLLEAYADGADSAAVHLKAAALPRQATHVILPIKSMKETEVYAPNYDDGTSVVLVRYPHGGIFEIPRLTVNNRNAEAKKIIGRNAPDAIGIHHKVAERLSGADFDGDTVLVIPDNNRKIKTEAALKQLEGFDPQSAYRGYPGMKKMDARTKGIEMGKVSNLITDMHLGGATFPEIAQAVKHSMVVIDAEKHGLDWKRSEIENGIPALKKRYQVGKNGQPGGASTLISRASAEYRVPERKARPKDQGGPIDPATGKKMLVETGATYVRKTKDEKTGEIKTEHVLKTQKTTKLAETDDAHTLVSELRTPIEVLYADYSNSVKALANEARKASLSVKPIPYSPKARKEHEAAVQSLDAKLNLALKNSPLERQAQAIAGAQFKQILDSNPDMESSEIKKVKFKLLERSRQRVGAGKEHIKIEPDEWAAIQAGAISPSKLRDILNNADLDKVKELATPKEGVQMRDSQKARAVTLLRSGRYTQAEVAAALGVSVSTLKRSLSSE